MALEINDDNFEKEVIKSSIPVLVDFWAPWCAPCRAITPTIEAVSKKFEGKIKVCKVNVDENPITPSKFQVSSIPTLIFFKGGKKVDEVIGMVPQDTIEKSLTKLV